jgi:hypothetical protein
VFKTTKDACDSDQSRFPYFAALVRNPRVEVHTWIFPTCPVDSIRLATFTELPHMSQCGFLAPITPAITDPWLIPENVVVSIMVRGDGQSGRPTYPEHEVVERLSIYLVQCFLHRQPEF